MDLYREGPPMGTRECLRLLRGITSLSDEERRSWADALSWWHDEGQFDYHECRTLAVALAWCALTEKLVFEVREGLLDSLCSLAEGGLAPLESIEQVVAGIPPENRHVAESEYFEVFGEVIQSRHEHPAVRIHVRAGEPVGPARCVQLVRGISSDAEVDRWYSSDLVTILLDTGWLDGQEAITIGSILGWAIAVESSDELRAKMLTSLAALARRDLLSARTIEDVRAALPQDALTNAETDDYRALIAAGRRLGAAEIAEPDDR